MKPKVHMDLALQPGMGVTIPVLAGLAIQSIHGVLARHPGSVALWFPKMKAGENPTPGFSLRLFAETGEDLERAVLALRQPRYADLVKLGPVQAVPDAWAGPWVICERFRIPSRKGKGNAEQMQKRQRIRMKRLAEARQLPFVRVRSGSTGQAVTLTLTSRQAPSAPNPGGDPDSYGLSRPQSQVWLPKLEQ